MYKDILDSVADYVATITLNRPDRLNAWTRQMEAELRAAVTAATADDNARAIVITGAGRGFCAGADMSILTGITETPRGREAGQAGSGSGDDNFGQEFSYLLTVRRSSWRSTGR
jgi:enoyl-CoA hydratase/carnithine racemase